METNYAVMRHASYGYNQEITGSGKNQITIAAEKLNDFFAKNEITQFQIWHSPQKRARLTGILLQEQLQIPCININEKEFLDCDYHEIQDNLPKEEIFTLMISHQPDIEHYLRKKYSINQDVYNCDILINYSKL
jgi:phosphohistidine phosphatase SixA